MKSNVRISRLPIFSMMQGFSSVENFWTVFVPNCEPFCGVTQFIPEAVVVPTANRGLFLAYESQAPSVVFVPNRQLPSVLLGLSSYPNVLSSPLILIVEDHPFIAPLIMPRQLLSEAGLTTLEPCNAIESEFVGIAAAQISAASKKPVAKSKPAATKATITTKKPVATKTTTATTKTAVVKKPAATKTAVVKKPAETKTTTTKKPVASKPATKSTKGNK